MSQALEPVWNIQVEPMTLERLDLLLVTPVQSDWRQLGAILATRDGHCTGLAHGGRESSSSVMLPSRSSSVTANFRMAAGKTSHGHCARFLSDPYCLLRAAARQDCGSMWSGPAASMLF